MTVPLKYYFFDVTHIVKNQKQSDEMSDHIQGTCMGAKCGQYGSKDQDMYTQIIFDTLEKADWFLLKYPEAKLLTK